MLIKLVPLFLLLFTGVVHAATLEIPRNLGSDDRKRTLEVLGYGSQVRLLSSPQPLGGHGDHQGFEFGLSSESIPLGTLQTLGSGSHSDGTYSYLNLSFAKGLPYNVDLLAQFTPIPQSGGAFGYGAQLRWGFYEFEQFPGVLSFVIHGSGMNYNDELSTRTTGVDLVMTTALDNLAFYFGGGTVRSIGTFIGGADSVTADGKSEEEDINALHSLVGVNYGFSNFFVALEGDHVKETTYAVRLGIRL